MKKVVGLFFALLVSGNGFAAVSHFVENGQVFTMIKTSIRAGSEVCPQGGVKVVVGRAGQDGRFVPGRDAVNSVRIECNSNERELALLESDERSPNCFDGPGHSFRCSP